MTSSYTAEEVAQHNSSNSCWVIIEGNVYDVTSFLDDHPGSFVPIVELAGKDATQAFVKKPHSKKAVAMLAKFLKGTLKASEAKLTPLATEKVEVPKEVAHDHKVRKDPITWAEFETHVHKESLWILVHGKVYDVTNFKSHPGSFEKLLHNAGVDATKEFDRVGHKASSIKQMEKYYIGEIDPETVPEYQEGETPVQPDRWMYIGLIMLVAFTLFFIGYRWG